MTATPILQVHNLSVAFETPRGVVHAVDDVSFDVARGETLGIVGESGCGKTVTALSLLKLIPQPPGRISQESRVLFDGVDVLSLEGEALRKIRGARVAMIFQDPVASLNPVLTIGEQIAETIRAHKPVSRAEAREQAILLLDRVGIPDPAHRYRSYPHQMSGGMLQRVMIAIALSCTPDVLVADEPTTALDVTIQAQILDLLRGIQDEYGMSLILITHDLGVIAEIADRVIVMYAGQVVEEAATETIFSQPAHPYTRGLIDSVPRVDQPQYQITAIPGSVPPASNWPSGCRFHPRCPYAWDRCETEPQLERSGSSSAVRCWLAVDTDKATE
ncbi:MAG: ABC transporter ATP-binding protein [Gemmatimonadetes bacterium]|nr:ABC transporter ATP-binding protein [Gemmatimonadota bacterium]